MRCCSAQAPTVSSSMPMRATRYLRPSPITTASRTKGDTLSLLSISDGLMFLPPAVMMMSFLRSVMRRKPSASSSPTSPV